jgi:hypothetical protein
MTNVVAEETHKPRVLTGGVTFDVSAAGALNSTFDIEVSWFLSFFLS